MAVACPVPAGRGQSALAVRRNAPAVEDRVDRVASGPGLLQPLEHDEATAFARGKAVAALVVDAHLVRGQRPRLGKADQLEGVQADVHAPHQGQVQVTRAEQVGAGADGQQRRGAGPVHGVAAAVAVEEIANPAGDGVGQATSQRVLGDRRKDRLVDLLQGRLQRLLHGRGETACRGRGTQGPADKRPAQPHRVGAGVFAGQGIAQDHAGPITGQRLPGVARIGQRLAGHFQRQPLDHVRVGEGARGMRIPAQSNVKPSITAALRP